MQRKKQPNRFHFIKHQQCIVIASATKFHCAVKQEKKLIFFVSSTSGGGGYGGGYGGSGGYGGGYGGGYRAAGPVEHDSTHKIPEQAPAQQVSVKIISVHTVHVP